MAIAFARARYISRSTGGCAVRSACYNAREAITDARSGERFSFAHRDAPEHHEVLLPDGADARLKSSAVLWNLAEGAERRRDAQVAREIVLALPADAALTHEDRVALAQSFAEEHFVARGLAVQLDVHAPHEAQDGTGGESKRANHHAHLLITTRRVEGDRLAAKKARDLDPEVRSFSGRPAVTDGERWGQLWREHQNAYFAAHGLDLRVDETGAVPGQHVGPIRMRTPGSAAVERAEAIARENAAAARDPETVLRVLTRNNASFTERELDRHLAKHIHDEAEHLAVKGRVLGHGETLALHDPETGEAVGRYTTREVRAQERAALADGARVAEGRHRAVGAVAQAAALEGRSLRPDQRAAFDHATGAGGLKIVEGRAGTGKSYTLQAVRMAHEAGGYEVVGLAPTNSVAQDLKADGFGRAATVHSELFRLKNGRSQWTARTLLVVDEAAMLDARVTGELLAEARRSGAKVILAGDDRQLASIERGGLFAELRQWHGSAEITAVTRQRVDWQRAAARDLAEGRVADAVRAFAREGALVWAGRQDAARAALVARWTADTAVGPEATRFVFAYTNKEVDALNAELRAVRRARGELGPDVRFETEHGPADFAVGDRVQFTDTLKSAAIYNGNAGVITAIDAATGTVRARLDSAGGQGREVTWSAEAFAGFRHGYAGTIYKGQGKTLDHTYLYHSHHWRQASSYVALTRQRESATIFAATETARDLGQLARQMSRVEVRSASVAWATREELPEALRSKADEPARRAEGQKAQADDAARIPREGDSSGDAFPVGATPNGASKLESSDIAEQGWLIAPHVAVERPDRGALAEALAADPAVRREQEALGRYLEGAFRDPRAAQARLTELVRTHGATSAARRLEADPGQLGAMRGRKGLLAGPMARWARQQAERVAQAVGPAVSRTGAAEAAAATSFRAGIQARHAAEATGIPALSARARHAIGGIVAATDPAARADAWKALQADARVASEVDAFMQAVHKRFGAEGVRLLDRSGAGVAEKGDLTGMKITAAEGGALAEVGRIVKAVRGGERAATSQVQRLGESAQVRRGSRLKP